MKYSNNVNEQGVPLKPQSGWYNVQVDTGILYCHNPHRKGTKAAAKYEEKWLKEHPLEKRIYETTAYLCHHYDNVWSWTQCGIINCNGGYNIKVVGIRKNNLIK